MSHDTLVEDVCKPTYEGYFEGHSNDVTALSFDPTSDQFISSSLDKTIMVWKLDHRRSAYKFFGHTDGVLDVCYSPSGRLVASASRDTFVRIWVPKIKGASIKFKAHSSAVTSVQFNPNAEELVTASNDKTVKLWSVGKRFLKSFSGHTSWVNCARFSPTGRLLVSCGDDKMVKVWDVASGKCVKTFTEINALVRCVDFHPNSPTVGSASEDGCVKLYDLRMDSLCQLYNAHKGPVNMIKFHPRGNFMLTASSDSTMKILDILEGRPIYNLRGHRNRCSVTSIAFSTNGKLFASGGTDRQVLIWKSNVCVDGKIGRVPTQLMPSEREPHGRGERSNSDEEDVVGKRDRKKYLSDTLETLDLKSDKSRKESPKKETRSEMVDTRNVEFSEGACATNVPIPRDQASPEAPSSYQSVKTVEALCDKIQSLHRTVTVLERRLTILEEAFNMFTTSFLSCEK